MERKNTVKARKNWLSQHYSNFYLAVSVKVDSFERFIEVVRAEGVPLTVAAFLVPTILG
jgi:hypothetical protein